VLQLGDFKLLGGHLGRVYYGRIQGKDRAIKIPNDEQGNFLQIHIRKQQLFHESNFLTSLNLGRAPRPKIIRAFGPQLCQTKNGLVQGLELEYLIGSPCSSFISKNGPVELIKALKIIRDISEALTIVHDSGKIHGDIKPDNIMVFDRVFTREDFTSFSQNTWQLLQKKGYACVFLHEGTEYLMITDNFPLLSDYFVWDEKQKADLFAMLDTHAILYDFGTVQDIGKTLLFPQTQEYQAPEKILNPINLIEAEIYSLGLTLFELLTGTIFIRIQNKDFSRLDSKTTTEITQQHERLIDELKQTNLPCRIKALIRWMTFYDTSDRSGSSGVQNRPQNCQKLLTMIERIIRDIAEA